MDHILIKDDTELAELTLDDAVGGDSCAVQHVPGLLSLSKAATVFFDPGQYV